MQPSDSEVERARAVIDKAVKSGDLKALAGEGTVLLCAELTAKVAERARTSEGPLIVAISGSPGAGKSTLVRYLTLLLAELFGLSACGFSSDDLYYPAAYRKERGRTVHPLLAVRGPPGAHDLSLGFRTLHSLSTASSETVTRLPRFSKWTDEPFPVSEWPRFVGRPAVIFIDSWIWNTEPFSDEELLTPYNAREAEEDAEGTWRRAVNDALKRDYGAFFSKADYWIHLQVPNFETTLRFREEQQKDLERGLSDGERAMSSKKPPVSWFLQVFQRWAERGHTKTPDVTLVVSEDHSFSRGNPADS